jgi:peptidoglycan/xylan/chitin deacetylase (PgdA/CDA1 family)
MGAIKNAVVGATLATSVLAHAGHGHLSKRALPFDGSIYYSCVTAGTVALTFDDGPFQYTQHIVDQLTASGHRATFFQNGKQIISLK